MKPVVTGATVLACCFAFATTMRFEPRDTGARAATTAAGAPRSRSSEPERPRLRVESGELAPARRTIEVPKDGNLQSALDEARAGDRIVLEPGAIYTGPFTLRSRNDDGWVVVLSAAIDRLPAAGERVSPSHAPLMPKLRAASNPVIEAGEGAHHYRFVGIDIAPSDDTFLHALVQIGDDEDEVSELPHHIVLDRCYLHGDPRRGGRRGVAMNGRHIAILDSYFADFKEVDADSQAIAGWNGAGPFEIANNYLEAAGENVMFGGADPAIEGLVPADIEVIRNHFSKPLRWKREHPDFEGTPWTVKNLFELKNARRVLIDGNLFENSWPAAQNGFGILFTVRNQSGGAPWSVVEDVVFQNNLVRRVASGINVLGYDDNQASQQTSRIAIRDNVFMEVGGAWGPGRLFQLLDRTSDIAITHNTAFHTGSIVFGGDSGAHERFVFTDNIVQHNEYGIVGSGTGSGEPTLAKYFPGAVVRRNLIVGGDPSRYPSDNLFPPSLQAIGSAALDGSFRLTLKRPYAGAGSNGRDPGADMDAVLGAMKRVTSPHDHRATPSPLANVDVATASLSGALGEWVTRTIDAAVTFWVSLLALAYVYVGYPCIAWLRARLMPRRRIRAPIEPTVTIVVVAYNEAARIGARIENLLSLDYPADRLEIVIGSDGSLDATAPLAGLYEDAGVKVHAFRARRGKPAVLNELVPEATGEIVVLADARQNFETGCLRALMSHFADPAVGAVSGELMLTGGQRGTAVSRGTAFYWRYEKFIRGNESRASSTVGATGAIYAFRRVLFEPIPSDTILDDVQIPLNIVRRGYAVLFEPDARAYDEVSATAHQEYVRKLRTIAGTFQLFARHPWLLDPMRNPLWFETISHKGLRLMLPAIHATLLGANLLISDAWLYQGTLAAQLGFYAAAIAGHRLRHAPRRPLVLAVPYAMCLLLWATVAGFGRFLARRQSVTWERAATVSARS